MDDPDLDYYLAAPSNGFNGTSGDITPKANLEIEELDEGGDISPLLVKTPSLVDELLSEIYSRFGDGLASTSRITFDSSQRASASGSQVRKQNIREQVWARILTTFDKSDSYTLGEERLKKPEKK